MGDKKPKVKPKLVETEIPTEVNFRRASRMLEFCSYCVRLEHNPESTVEALDAENARVDEIAKDMKLDGATVIRSADIQVSIFYVQAKKGHPAEIVVTFSGSNEDRKHFFRNIDFLNMVPSGFGEDVRVHHGFNSSLDTASIRHPDKTLWEEIELQIEQLQSRYPNALLNFTGHSAGGSMAMIGASRWLGNKRGRHVNEIVTFGQPRTGGTKFRDAIEDAVGKNHILRFELDGDPVPALPPFNEQHYRHCGTWIPFNKEGKVLRREDPSEPVEDTSAYDSKVESPAWSDLLDVKGAIKHAGDLPHTTRKFFQFMLFGFEERHKIPAYHNAVMKIAKEQEAALEDDSRPRFAPADYSKYVSPKDSDELMWNMLTLDDMLSHAHMHQGKDEQKAAYIEAKKSISDMAEKWPRDFTKTHAEFMARAIEHLLDTMIPEEKNEPFRHAREHAEQALALSQHHSNRQLLGLGA